MAILWRLCWSIDLSTSSISWDRAWQISGEQVAAITHLRLQRLPSDRLGSMAPRQGQSHAAKWHARSGPHRRSARRITGGRKIKRILYTNSAALGSPQSGRYIARVSGRHSEQHRSAHRSSASAAQIHRADSATGAEWARVRRSAAGMVVNTQF